MKHLIFCLFILNTTLLLQGCGSYVDRVHREIDNAEARKRPDHLRQQDPYANYRGGPRRFTNDKRPITNPRTFSNIPQANGPDTSINGTAPRVKRFYKEAPKKRLSSDDFIDSEGNGSLWASEDTSLPNLFTSVETKKEGDIVVINVKDNLRKEISNELKRAFPPRKVETKEKDAKGKAEKKEVAKTETKEEETLDKVYDKISSQVAELISDDYLLLKGRKEIIYRSEKRLVEVQALVSRKDIEKNDSVMSDQILESRIYILR